MRLVLIEWVDSFGCSSNWQEIKDDVHPAPITVKSVGWLAYDGTSCKTIIPHISDAHEHADAQGCGDMTIPASSIMRMVDLSEKSDGEKSP